MASLPSVILPAAIISLSLRFSGTAQMIGVLIAVLAVIAILKAFFEIPFDKAYIVWSFALVSQVLVLLGAGLALGTISELLDPQARSARSAAQSSGLGGEVVAPGELGWLSYGDGVARAAAEGKPMVLDFWTDWCHWCKVMDKDTYGNPEVRRQMAQHFVAIKVDAESEKPQGGAGSPTGVELARSFGVASYPTTWFVDSKGEKIAPLPGFVPPEQFGPILDYIASNAYKTQTFQSFQAARDTAGRS